MGWVALGVVVLLGPVAASVAPLLKQQSWWPWRSNRKAGG